jgi:hypothetical protein
VVGDLVGEPFELGGVVVALGRFGGLDGVGEPLGSCEAVLVGPRERGPEGGVGEVRLRVTSLGPPARR